MSSKDLSEYGEITSIVVSRGGEMVTEQYLEGDAATLRNTRSCTKTVASMLAGIAIERGLVPGVDVALCELLGVEVDDPRKRAITARDVLTMSSCLECDDWDESSPGNEELHVPARGLGRIRARVAGARGRAASRTARPALSPWASRSSVRSAARCPEFARNELFDPLGIEQAEWQTTPLGQVSTAGGLLLTSRSLLALGELYLRGGGGVVPRAWVEESTRPHARIDERDASTATCGGCAGTAARTASS